ncbi:MAG: hypothetical protein OHK0029_03080 [Armatimonadaceae bacterium]
MSHQHKCFFRFICAFLFTFTTSFLISQKSFADLYNYKIVVSGNGHIPCKDNQGTDLPPQQYWDQIFDPGFGGKDMEVPTVISNPTAAKKASNITITFDFKATDLGWNGTVQVLNATYGSDTVPASLLGSGQLNVAPNGWVTLQVNVGALPDKVHPAQDLLVSFVFTKQGQGYSTLASMGPNLYLVYDTPASPQIKPWLGVLNDVCTWAKDQNTASSVAQHSTVKLNANSVFVYAPPPYYYATYVPQGSTTGFQLKQFLATSRPVVGNCYDVSCYLAICLSAVGLPTECTLWTAADPQFGANFTSNQLVPIGQGGSPRNVYWSTHQTVAYNDKVYDSCSRIEKDYNGNFWGLPVYGWGINFFWQNPAWPHYGLTRNPGGVNDPHPALSASSRKNNPVSVAP